MEMKDSYRPVLLLACSLVFIAGCHHEEVVPKEEYYSSILDGKYDLVSLTSETAVDLDHDSIFSMDIVAETHTVSEPNPPVKCMECYFVELTTEVNDFDPKLVNQKFFLWAPNATIFSDVDGNYLYTDYGCEGLLA